MVLWHLFICVVLRKIGNDTKFAVPRNPFHLRNVYINTIGMAHIKPLHPTHITHVRLHMPSTHVRCMKHETTPNRTSTTDASVKSNMSKILQFIFAVILASTPTNRLSIAKYKLYLCVVLCAQISPRRKFREILYSFIIAMVTAKHTTDLVIMSYQNGILWNCGWRWTFLCLFDWLPHIIIIFAPFAK